MIFQADPLSGYITNVRWTGLSQINIGLMNIAVPFESLIEIFTKLNQMQ
jgi:hypothetical protein